MGLPAQPDFLNGLGCALLNSEGDALGIYEINYIEDPDSPLSKAIGKVELVDTVRFPRKTLMIKSGDCDDSTALLGSLLESAGTIPGVEGVSLRLSA